MCYDFIVERVGILDALHRPDGNGFGSPALSSDAGVSGGCMPGFYHTKRWERVRAAVLRRDGYVCQVSKRYGRRVAADTVHHVFPRDVFPQFEWDGWNLVSVAREVHEQLHDRATGELTEKGRELLRRVARREGIEVPARYQG